MIFEIKTIKGVRGFKETDNLPKDQRQRETETPKNFLKFTVKNRPESQTTARAKNKTLHRSNPRLPYPRREKCKRNTTNRIPTIHL